jgi:hypothetical protein
MSLAEVLFSIGLIGFFTVAVVAVIIKGMDLNRRDAMITQSTMYCNEILERDARLAADAASFPTLANITYAVCPVSPNEQVFIYSQEVFDYSANTTFPGSTVVFTKVYSKVNVQIYYPDPTSAVYTPDLSRPNGGRVLQMCRIFAKPSSYRGGS